MKKCYSLIRKICSINIDLRALQISVMLVFCFFNSAAYAQQTYTFTNCGATGRTGPTQTMVTSAYAATNLSLVGTSSPTSGIQTWTVPFTGLYRITAYGASGGDATSYTTTPGNGAIMSGDFNLSAGSVLRILVGQMGQDRQFSAGGGGATYVTQTPHNTLGSILVVAGGGGAASQDFSGLSAVTATCGTFDVQSGPAQCNGDGGLSFTGNSGGGGGGFFTDGQNGGIGMGGMSYTLGGLGGATNNQQAGGFGGGGGQNGTGTYAACGGGGFSGGNGGNRASTSGTGRMGGGGGGSYNSGTNQLNSVNTVTGHGRVIISELCSITLTSTGASSLNPSICSGTSLTLTTNGINNYTWSTGNTTSSSIVVSPTVTTVYSVTATSPSLCLASALITVSVSSGQPTLAIVSSTNQTCLGNTTTLTASGALTYTWSNNVLNGVSFTPTITNTYSVIGQNACGTGSAVTTISIAPLAINLAVSPTVICAGATATINASASANSYTWLPINSISSNSTLIISPLQNITYSVSASDGTCSGTSTISIAVNPSPTIQIVASNTQVCQGDPVILTASGGINYTWTPGNIAGASVTVNPTNPVSYSVASDNSFACLSGTTIVIITIPSPTVIAQANNYFICKSATVTLSAIGASTYSWSSGSTNSLTNENPAVTTIYSVTGTSNGCSNTQTLLIDVFDPIVSIAGPTTICEGLTTTLTANGATSYTWQPGSLPGQFLVVSPTQSSTYTVNATANSTNNISCPASNTVQISLKPNPTVTAIPDRSVICTFETTTINANGASTYSWVGKSAGQSIVVTSSLITTLFYQVIGTSANGCTSEASVTVKVNSCNGINETGKDVSDILVYPNPAKAEFYIKATANLQFNLVNELGQVVKVISLNELNNNQVRVTGLTEGIYFLTGSNSDVLVTKKIIVLNH